MVETQIIRALHARLTAVAGFYHLPIEALEEMDAKGLAHDHLRVKGTGWLLRVPKQSQFGFSASENLTYQAACFGRVGASGQAPRLRSVFEPGPDLPMGALLVEEINGMAPILPRDLPLLAEAMARVHALPLPPPAERPPLEDHSDPVAGILKEIESQARYLKPAGLDPRAEAAIEGELDWARSFAAAVRRRTSPQPVTLVLTDTHPGNFLITSSKAVIVDLEKALYGAPGIDLAHATVYSSTTWDSATYAVLTLAEIAGFYRAYLTQVAALKSMDFAVQLEPWLIPMRRLLLLRALTWCALWRVEHKKAATSDKTSAAETRDWSADNTDATVIDHVRDRVDHYLSGDTVTMMQSEWLESPTLEGLIDL
ncbi:aminoglycoside phosphotransferase family protein [Limibacillus halophilus]|uniref:Aminoglycoside phosphotransferase (APT) family kinase protein n=1 Tax=Limibacillus halophilus TaxID=1579333 RepID=A0A839SYK7_9PROT|nr:aminoglycoside phosphotransferase family protein [Limibacillus halophilus]MBB3066023.1 aminoglycoside phosphotransferase (APT) family kinase protein [Limibacillus halophilus]